MYFNNMPTIPFPREDGSVSNVKDIIRRVVFTDESYLRSSNYDFYTIDDADTPDSIAQQFYDNPAFHWIIILYNNAFDPFYTYPLSQQNLDDYINKKYEGPALFISPTDSEVPFFDKNLSWEVADVVTVSFFDDQNAEQFKNEEVFGRVKVIDNLHSKLQLDKTTGIFNTGDRLARRKDIVDNLRATVRRSVRGRSALHHFEDPETKQILDPLATPPTNGIQYAIHTDYPGFDRKVVFSDTLLYNYIYNLSSNFVVSNEEYEEVINNNKRKIRIPRKDVVEQIFKEYKDIVRD